MISKQNEIGLTILVITLGLAFVGYADWTGPFEFHIFQYGTPIWLQWLWW